MSSQDRHQALLTYWKTGYTQVEGWMGEGLFPLLQLCDDLQHGAGARGGVVEVGIHHGKFFIALNQLCAADEPSMAIDVFARQDLNVDNSGQGSLERFTDNLQKYCTHEGRNVHIVTADSTTLKPRDILQTLGMKPRFFSVDGGHTVRHVMHDIALADACIGDFGVVLVDDIHNPHWLGVVEGTCRYLLQRPVPILRRRGLVPFAVHSNKLFLCRPSAYSQYAKAFGEYPERPAPVQFFGHTVLVW